MLDLRAQQLLKTLIECYIADGQPVSSRALSRCSGLELSPATVRNVMADLEELGFVSSPHTSSGRIPTPRGYRLFVDTILAYQPFVIDEEVRSLLSSKILPDQPQRVMNVAAKLLSNLSQFAGIVSTPRRSHTFRQIEFMRLSQKRILIILVTPEGDIQNRIVMSQTDFSPADLIEAANYINSHFSGLGFEEIKHLLYTEIEVIRHDMLLLMQEVVQTANEDSLENEMVITGEHNLLDANYFPSNMDNLRELFALFDKKTTLLHLLDVSSQAQGVQIYIGGDSALMPVKSMTVVTAPYKVDGKIVGTLGVIGPTRMAYARVLPIVDITARLVSSALSQTT